MMNAFTCFSISPIGLEHPGIAVATARAGGVGILDREFCQDRDLELASQNLDRLLQLVQPTDAVGLRLRLDQLLSSQELLQSLGDRPHWLILCQWQVQDLPAKLAALPQSDSRQILLEITDAQQLSGPELASVKIAGLVARGHETGGWIGEDAAFLLAQKLLANPVYPVYVQGGIGVHTAAACRAAGAAGVVLDDQLWLMPESPLPESWQKHLHSLNGQEAIPVGERLESPLRVLSRPTFQVIPRLQQLADQVELTGDCPETLKTLWQQQVEPLVGWGEPGEMAWPMGQAVGLAAGFRQQYKTVGRLVQALLRGSEEHLRTAETLKPLAPDAPLAQSHRTRYPIVQGPMTRVSDSAEFAAAVAKGGGLPLLALALMRGAQVRTLLQTAQTLMGDRSWGVGILGFVSHALREEQLQAVLEVKPPFALIAGGRPDQAAHLEAQGIATYIHVPVPRLLKMFLEQGARRFVFEGRECGGHVGPLSSFLLWESIIDTLLAEVPKGAESEVHVLFAGGIHDARSAAMVSAMAAPLAQRGMRVGVLMGTAYLFTQEAVNCGAIVEGFQEQALACSRTINLETGPGHASRCAVTPFAQEFYATRRKMLAAGEAPEEIKNVLEDLTLGRLRIASKGLVREGDQILSVAPEQQLQDGMYMIGQVATLRQEVTTIAQLHGEVSEASQELLSLQQRQRPTLTEPAPSPADIAIIGIGTLLPRAEYPASFWQNILQRVEAITEIPASRWDWRLYYDSDRQARDKVYSKWGGFLEAIPFDPMRFGIPPKSLKSIEPSQLLALEAVRRALADAGYEGGDFDREMTSVILGAGGGIADLGQQYATRSEVPRFVDTPSEQVWDRLPEWTEESFPGLLLNVIAGRVTNRFDLGGSNFTVDAACASSLAAVHLAVWELETGRSNLAIAGGVDTVQSPFAYLCFSKTQALSPQGRPRTFDQAADGIVISEGIGMVVLKRLADAERDGDRIYGVIKAVAGSSDGKALGLTAPLPGGQMRAVQRAYGKAGFSPSTLGLYEAHGTGTAAGDRAELETIVRTLEAEAAPSKTCAIGSVKTMIGHTKSTAGVAGLIKVVLALHHKVLPPHINVKTPLEPITNPDSPVYLLKEARPWLRHPDYPRRGGVSAFGFGGTNFHAVLEEYTGAISPQAPGAEDWPYELLVFRARDRQELSQQVQALHQALSAGATPRLRDLAYTYARLAQERRHLPGCLNLVVGNLTELTEALALVLAHLAQAEAVPLPQHIQLGWQAAATEVKLAFMFPGQASQYPDMARQAALYIPEIRQALEFADRLLRPHFPKLLSQYIYPPSPYSEAEETRNLQLLSDTHVAQPAIGALETGYLDLMVRLGIKPAIVCGHSYGEYTALHAAGALSRADFLSLSEIRGRIMAAACAASIGAMAAVQATREELQAYLKEAQGVVLANRNAPRQSVISGDQQAVKQMVETLNAAGITARMLPVAGAFHSALIASAQVALANAIASIPMGLPQVPVYSNTTAAPYENDVAAIRAQLAKHLRSPVDFLSEITAIYDSGIRIFVELGPKSILNKLVSQILSDREHTVISVDGQGGGLKALLLALGTLSLRGVNSLQLPALFAGREVQPLDLGRLVEITRKPPLPPTTWLVEGGSVRPLAAAKGHPGKLPPLTVDTVAQPQPTVSQPAASRPGALPPAATPATAVPASPPISASAPKMTDPSPHSAMSISASNSAAIVSNRPEMMAPAPAGVVSSLPSPGPIALVNPQLAAYQAYQETMRQFLSLQEKVMLQFLGGTAMPRPAMVAMSAPPTLASTAVVQPPVGVLPPQQMAYGRSETSAAPVPAAPPPQPLAPPVATNGSPRPAPLPPQPAAPTIAPTPVVAPAAAASPRPDRQSLTQLLVILVSDRTGYPTEMLGLEQDMEAELGIDSIKRVEIFGALQKQLPEALAQPLQEQMERFTRIKTLNGVIEALAQLLPAEGASALEPTAANGNGHSPLLPDAQTLTQLLVHLVSDRTGYPTEMLGLEQDMEAELGIDSIKRVEIFGALQKQLPEALAQPLQAQMERFTRIKTLNGVIAALSQLTPAPTAQEDQRLGKLEPVVAVLPRYVMQACPQPLPPGKLAAATGLFLITEDQLAIAPILAETLTQQGATPVILPSATLLDPEQLTQSLTALRQTHGPVAGIVHLAALAPLPIPSEFSLWRNYTQLQVKSLFQLLHLCATDLQQAERGRVLAASLLGGHLGRGGTAGPGLPTGGSHCGYMKTLIAEWPTLLAKAVDLDPDLSPEILAQQLLQELLSDRGRVEVGYPQGQRTIFQSVSVPLEPSPTPHLTPTPDWVVLVTGGARGITAEIVDTLLVPGMQLILVGSSAEPDPEAAETAGITDIAILRRQLLQPAMAQGQAPTPVQIERQLQGLMRDRTIRGNLERFRQRGAKVEYAAVNVRNPDSFGALIEDLYHRYGRLDAVIHGAGIIDDRLIVDKTLASFEQVFDTKVDSGFILSQHLRPETLKLLVFFTSVAGRYGNRGQVDYAAANEVLNRLAWNLDHQWPSTRVIAINWGPWDSPGMASPQVKQQLLQRGIVPIPGPAGCRFFLDELQFGRKGETEVIAGEGPWEATEALQNCFIPGVIEPDQATPPAPERQWPLLVAAPQLQPNSTVILNHSFTLATDPYLGDHCLDGKPVLPAAGALEWMAEFVQANWPEWQVSQVRDLRVLRGVVLTAETPLEVQFRARASSHADAEALAVAVEMLDAQSNLPLYRATVILQTAATPVPDIPVAPLTTGRELDPGLAYRDYLFHGPLFQQIRAIAHLNREGIDAQVMPTPISTWQPKGCSPSGSGAWIFDPGLVDTAPQLAIIWARTHLETTALPSRLGEVVRYGSAPLQGPLQLLFRVKKFDAHTLIYDAAFIDSLGHLRLSLNQVESTCNQSLNRLAGHS